MTGERPRASFEKLLRWYPAPWRARYGDELVAFMEDSYGDGPIPARSRIGVARAGIVERLVGLGLGGRDQTPAERLRGGALRVLCAWALFVIGGAIFAKAAEGWPFVMPSTDHRLPTVGYDAVFVAAIVGLVVVALGATLALPAFIRFLGGGHWSEIRLVIVRAAIVTGVTAAVGAGTSAWAHQLDVVQRNGGYWPYTTAFLILGVLGMGTIASWTGAIVHTVRRLDLSLSLLRLQAMLALLLGALMIVIVAGTVVWWSAVAIETPRILSGPLSGPLGYPVPPNLVVAGLFMVAGIGVAAQGARGVASALRSSR